MNVLITGCAGMLGSAVYPAFINAGHDVTATDLQPQPLNGWPMTALDVRDYHHVRGLIVDTHPRLIVHLAAETDLETCEDDPDHAWLTNTVGTQNVALLAEEFDITLVYVSTAGVFNGEKQYPYDEFDRPAPINIYGRSKYEGEKAVARLRRHFIVRAGWMIGGGRRDHKFVAKIRSQLDAGATTIYAVTDKIGTPTYTRDFAANLLELVGTPYYGLYHMVNSGMTTRYEVAVEILDALGRDDVLAVPATPGQFDDEYFVPRPRSEVMRNYMLGLRGLDRMRPWQLALRDYLRRDW
jgi:dTDP-4-dehydrorhamnose reductase